MGDLEVVGAQNSEEKRSFYLSVLDDLDTLDLMLKEGMIDDGVMHIGAEQELCIIDNSAAPATSGPSLLEEIPFKEYTNELGVFNLEINLDPHPLRNDCFEKVQHQLSHLLDAGEQYAKKLDHRFVLTGILPTLQKKHLDFKYITPQPRYELLSKTLLDLRGHAFQIHLQGVDELNSSLDSVLFEACNTSFQLHLQIRPDDFVDAYNWSQMIAGPVLATGVNSPLLFGRELWSESRIGLFKQSLDTRAMSNHIRTKMARVSFGKDWIRNSFTDIYKNQLSRFPLLVIKKGAPRSSDILKAGKIPKLPYLLLHNGTTYSWNRPCYGPSGIRPHTRIECRYLPSGPSIPDEIANLVFWVGLMNAMPTKARKIYETVDFRSAKGNFVKAARDGLNTAFDWFGQYVSTDKLVRDTLVPMAREGLKNCQVDETSMDHYLHIIEERARKNKTGAQWTVNNFRKLSSVYSVEQSAKIITEYMAENRTIPVHEWPELDASRTYAVANNRPSVMSCLSTDLLTIHENVPVKLVRRIMEWNNINHILVEDKDKKLMGVVSSTDLENASQAADEWPVEALMTKKLISISVEHTPEEASQIMKENKVRSLPVMEGKDLVGIVTSRDLEKCNAGIKECEDPLNIRCNKS